MSRYGIPGRSFSMADAVFPTARVGMVMSAISSFTPDVILAPGTENELRIGASSVTFRGETITDAGKMYNALAAVLFLRDPADAEPEALIPAGWVLCSADFSLQAAGRSKVGSVTITRDRPAFDAWCALPSDDEREGLALSIYGRGVTLREAIADAVSRIES